MLRLLNAFLFNALLYSSLIAIPPSEDNITIQYIHALNRAHNAMEDHHRKIKTIKETDDSDLQEIRIALFSQYLSTPCKCKIPDCRDTACKTHEQLEIFFNDLNVAIPMFSSYLNNCKIGCSVDPIFQERYGTLQRNSLWLLLSHARRLANYKDEILHYLAKNPLVSHHSAKALLQQPLRQEFPSLRHSIAFLLNHDDDQESSEPAHKRRRIESE